MPADSAFRPYVEHVDNIAPGPGTDGPVLWLTPQSSNDATIPAPQAAPYYVVSDASQELEGSAKVGSHMTIAPDNLPIDQLATATLANCQRFINNIAGARVAEYAVASGAIVSSSPLLVPADTNTSDQTARRHLYYHHRHHPSTNAVSYHAIEDVKNKNRFSATGANADCTVVRDSKMSLSSTPPSPLAGTVGGSLGSNVPRMPPASAYVTARYFATPHPLHHQHYFSPLDKRSDNLSISTSSSLSSTSSFTSASPLKRKATDSICGEAKRNSPTNDVTAGVGGVRIVDETTGVSPVPTDWPVSLLQPNKRSKTDIKGGLDDDDDDVIFVSMTPGPCAAPHQSNKHATNNNKNLYLPKDYKPVKQSKRTAKSNKTKTQATRESTTFPVEFVVPSTVASCPARKLMIPPAISNPRAMPGYFLRSSKHNRTTSKPSESNVDGSNEAENIRYQTRSQKRGKDSSVLPQPMIQSALTTEPPSEQSIITTSTPPAYSPKSPPKVSPPRPMHVPQPAASSLGDTQQRYPSAFKKKYSIQGMIGVGGGGTVYAGTRKSDNVQVAVKQVPKSKVKRWGKLNGRVVPIEFELLHRAAFSGNKGVIAMLDWFEHRNYYILVMERPQPVIDMFDYLNQHGALPEKVARNIFRQIVEAVMHCHANGVVHRDIKDENVLVNLHTSEAKLIDFGCGTFLKDAPYTEFAGTPEFYPPEWFTERRYMGQRVDAWSLGVLLYTMIEAEVPFQKEKDIVACELRHKRAQTTTSASCRQLIASMLQRDQRLRPTLTEVLQHPWLTHDASSSSLNPPPLREKRKVATRCKSPDPLPPIQRLTATDSGMCQPGASHPVQHQPQLTCRPDMTYGPVLSRHGGPGSPCAIQQQRGECCAVRS